MHTNNCDVQHYLAIHVSSTHYPTKASPIVWLCLIMGIFRNSILHTDCKIISQTCVVCSHSHSMLMNPRWSLEDDSQVFHKESLP